MRKATSRTRQTHSARSRLASNGRKQVVELRRNTKRQLDRLSVPRLQVAADFVSYLAHRETNPATEELLRIPGFVESLEAIERKVAAGHITPVEKLRRKY